MCVHVDDDCDGVVGAIGDDVVGGVAVGVDYDGAVVCGVVVGVAGGVAATNVHVAVDVDSGIDVAVDGVLGVVADVVDDVVDDVVLPRKVVHEAGAELNDEVREIR